MDDLFAPPGTAWRRVSPALARMRHTVLGAVTLAALAVVVAAGPVLDLPLWLVVVPYGRMQYVDVQAGPLDRAFGIARVQLHTASPGTSAHIPGLAADEAARLRDRLTSLGEAQAAGP